MTRAKNLQSSETKEGLLLISMEMNFRDIIRHSFLRRGNLRIERDTNGKTDLIKLKVIVNLRA